MNSALPILVWLSLWAAVLVFGFMIVLYVFLLLMGDRELKELRAESDADMRDVRKAEQAAEMEKRERREERKRILRGEAEEGSGGRNDRQ